MKYFLIALILLTGQASLGQSVKIDKSNYYQFEKDNGNLNWLRASDAIPIIIDELLKNKIAYYTISIGDLLKLNDSTRLVISVSFSKNDKPYGFLYEAVHGIPLNPKDRDFLSNKKKAYYVQAETDTKGEANFMRIDPLPDNIFLLKQRCYWFQFDDNGTKFPISKETAQYILRQDIDDYLKAI